MRRIIRDTYLGSVARPLLDRAYNWDDFYIPRADRPVRFVPRTLNAALLARTGFRPESFTVRFA